MKNAATFAKLIPGIILSAIAGYLLDYGFSYLIEYYTIIRIMPDYETSAIALELELAYVEVTMGSILLVIGLILLGKGLSSLKKLRVTTTNVIQTFTGDGRRHFAPAQCIKCGGSMVNHRCNTCLAAWCSNCGAWTVSNAVFCPTCGQMLPP